MKNFKSLISMLLVLGMLFTTFTSAFAAEAGEMFDPAEGLEEFTAVKLSTSLDGFEGAYENDKLAMFLKQDDSNIAILDKTTGEYHYLFPATLDTDSVTATSGINKLTQKSPILLSYFDSATAKNMYSNEYKDATKYYAIEDGVRAVYTLGVFQKLWLMPSVMTEADFDAYVATLEANGDDEGAKTLKKRYRLATADTATPEDLAQFPTLAEQNLRILRNGLQDYIKDEVEAVFATLNYTEEQKEIDNKLDITLGDEKEITTPYFIVTVDYKLVDGNFVIDCKAKDIQYNPTFPLYTISVAPFFDAAYAETEEEGYIFVPDASGALIYLNNGNMVAPTYMNNVYGLDKSTNIKETFQSYDQITMPVYGIKEGNNAFLTIIEDGAAVAKISAEVAGYRYSYNNVYATFYMIQFNSLDLSSLDGKNSRNVYQETICQTNIVLNYTFLSGDEASYAGMAKAYREYLLKNNLLNQTDYDDNTELYVTYVGAIDRVKTVFGMPVKVREPLTTFDQAKEITEALYNAGVLNLDVRYVGWMNGGYNHYVTNNVKVEKSLGGEKDLLALADYLNSKNETLFLDATFEYAHKDKMFDGFTTFRDSIRFLDRTTKPAYDLDIATYQHNKLFKKFIVKPTSVQKYVESYIEILNDYGNIGGISARTLGKDVNSDFYVKSTFDRTMAADLYTTLFAKMAENYKVMTLTGNDYTLASADVILNSSLTSNEFNSTDVSVPFYQIVVHNYVDYTGADMNLSTNYTKNILKTIETGASLSATLIYVENSIVSKTDFSFLYSVNYEGWVSRIAEEYVEINNILKDLQTVEITNHEILADNVFRTTYANGTKIIVNYNKDAYIGEGFVVDAQGYLVTK
ncbi:MAG: hypothetical protein IKV30_00360 [Clostridia bacterium]|nr:hypothetical protein [Clostridia bacterium]